MLRRLRLRALARRDAARPELPGRALARDRLASASSRRRSSSKGPVGLVSRSGTLTYQIGNELAQAGVGNSTIVGIGGDPIVGSSFIDILERFEADPQTELVVMVGEIGGAEEERAADFIAEHVSKPVVAYIAGFTAPPGKTMGHAGAIISGSSGTAQAQEGGARGARHPRRHQPDRGRPHRRRARPLDVTARARRALQVAGWLR